MTATAAATSEGRADSKVGRIFFTQPERVAAAWRRLRCAQLSPNEMPQHLLEDVVEPFVRELGATLSGQRGSPWGRTRGVLRLSRARGTRAIVEEFTALRRCLLMSLQVLGATPAERLQVERAVEEAQDGAVAIQTSLTRDDSDAPPTPFGGVVLEMFDAASLQRAVPDRAAAALH